MQRLVSRAEAARIAGVSGMAITKQCAGKLALACVGKRIDLNHPLFVEYLASKGKTPPGLRPDTPKSSKKTSPTRPRTDAGESVSASRSAPRGAVLAAPPPGSRPASVEAIEGFEDLTLGEIAERFGTISAHREWLAMRKTQVDIREKELKNLETEGRLIPRDGVQTHVFGAIGGVFRRLLQDTPKTIARRLYAMAKSGATIEEAERTVAEVIGSQLRPVKDQAARALRGLAAQAEKDAEQQ